MTRAKVRHRYLFRETLLLLALLIMTIFGVLCGTFLTTTDIIQGLALSLISFFIGLPSIISVSRHLKWRSDYSSHMAVFQLSRVEDDDLWKHLKTYPRTQVVMSPILDQIRDDISVSQTITELPHKKILLVGGPGSGKSTAIVHTVELIKKIGWRRTTLRAISPKVIIITQPQLLLDSRESIPEFTEPTIFIIDDFQDISSSKKFVELVQGDVQSDRIFIVASRPDPSLNDRFFHDFVQYDFSSHLVDPAERSEFLKRVAIHAAQTFDICHLPSDVLDSLVDFVVSNDQPVLYIVDLMSYLRKEGRIELLRQDIATLPPTLQDLYDEQWLQIETGSSKRSLLRSIRLLRMIHVETTTRNLQYVYHEVFRKSNWDDDLPALQISGWLRVEGNIVLVNDPRLSSVEFPSIQDVFLEMREIVTNHPTQAPDDILFAVGDSYFLEHSPESYEKALICFERLASQDPRNPGASFKLGELQLLSGNSDSARLSFEKAISIDRAFHTKLYTLENDIRDYGESGFSAERALRTIRRELAPWEDAVTDQEYYPLFMDELYACLIVKGKCPNCGGDLVSGDPIEIPSPIMQAESHMESLNDKWGTLYCDECLEEYSFGIFSGFYSTSFSMEGTLHPPKEWRFQYRITDCPMSYYK